MDKSKGSIPLYINIINLNLTHDYYTTKQGLHRHYFFTPLLSQIFSYSSSLKRTSIQHTQKINESINIGIENRYTIKGIPNITANTAPMQSRTKDKQYPCHILFPIGVYMFMLNITNNPFLTNAVIVFSFSVLSVILLLPPKGAMLLTYIHELGHVICLMTTALILKQKYIKSKIVIGKREHLLYNGKTYNILYKYLEEHKHYTIIRINALSGTIFYIAVFLIFHFAINYLFINTTLYICSLIFTTLFIFLPLITQYKSSDLNAFMHLEQFHYEEE